VRGVLAALITAEAIIRVSGLRSYAGWLVDNAALPLQPATNNAVSLADFRRTF
jgi:hypothetical protein